MVSSDSVPQSNALTMPTSSYDRNERLSFLTLPPELVYHILEWLPGISLLAVSLTCRKLHNYVESDAVWHALLKRLELVSPHPYLSYRGLFSALAPHLFLPRKLYMGDRRGHGHLLVSKYVPTTGTIEAYAMIEDKPLSTPHTTASWSMDPSVIVHSFNPKVRLWEDAELKISPFSHRSSDGEIPQASSTRGIYATFFRAQVVLEEDMTSTMDVWPPRLIPATKRVVNVDHDKFFPLSQVSKSKTKGKGITLTPYDDSPITEKRDRINWKMDGTVKSGDVSEHSFRLRKWTIFESQLIQSHMRLGDRIETYSEVEEELWTPTPEFPFRGIWIGDYGTQSTEFLLFHQPDNPNRETNHALQAIKLTGDPIVERGNISFTIPDLSNTAISRHADATEREWPNAKVYNGVSNSQISQRTPSVDPRIEVIVPETQLPEDTNWYPTHGRIDPTARRERRSLSLQLALFKTARDRMMRKTAPWVKREVIVWWMFNSDYGMRKFRRVDVDDLFGS